MQELQDETILQEEWIRQPGGGRKSAVETMAGLDEAFLRVLERHTAGSPIDEKLKWTNLKRHEIAQLLQEEGIEVSVAVVDQLLEKHHFRKRKAVKTLATGSSEHRNEQFETLNRLKQIYQADGNPVISMDTKKENCTPLAERSSMVSYIGRGNCIPRRRLRYLTMTGHR